MSFICGWFKCNLSFFVLETIFTLQLLVSISQSQLWPWESWDRLFLILKLICLLRFLVVMVMVINYNYNWLQENIWHCSRLESTHESAQYHLELQEKQRLWFISSDILCRDDWKFWWTVHCWLHSSLKCNWWEDYVEVMILICCLLMMISHQLSRNTKCS